LILSSILRLASHSEGDTIFGPGGTFQSVASFFEGRDFYCVNSNRSRRPKDHRQATLSKESRVIVKLLWKMNANSCEFRVLGVDEPVRFRWGQYRWHDKDRSLAIDHKRVADTGQLKRGRTLAPVGGEPT